MNASSILASRLIAPTTDNAAILSAETGFQDHQPKQRAPVSALFQVVPPLGDDEFAALKQDIAARGVLVPIEYDEAGNILDGHHRARACRELGIDFWPRVVRKGLSDVEKRRHARTLNLARRHLSPEQKRELVAAQLREEPQLSDRQIADELRVDRATVAEVRQSMVATGGIQPVTTRTGSDGVTRVLPVPRSSWTVKPGGTATSTIGTGQVEWYTPPAVVGAARVVLGGFDLDPASSPIAQRIVAAATFFTKETDGLAQPWRGKVWMNPPYSAGLVDRFVGKLVQHVRSGDVPAAIMLVDNRTDTQWFHNAATACQRICFTRGRIRFLDQDGEPGASPTNGSAIFYFGSEPDAFDHEFLALGLVVQPRLGGVAT